MSAISLRAYAKINLGLKVLGRRSDGYHELRTIYQSISLADDVAVTFSRGSGVSLESSGFAVPQGRENLAVRAADAMVKELRFRRGVRIRLHKRIPPASGLGGASSDAAAVLRAINQMAEQPLPLARLLHLAADLGSDVPFFLVGGRAAGVGRGEEVYPLADSQRLWVVVLFPGEGMSTAEAYRLLRKPRLTVQNARPTIELFSAAAMEAVSALKSDGRARNSVDNDFEPLLLRRMPQLGKAKRILQTCGASVASLSGSGSALFGLFADRATAANAARSLLVSWQHVYLARTVTRQEFHNGRPAASR
jgi:4-diphosphocytidyl-2-C-methyl-D-erythritol kinase